MSKKKKIAILFGGCSTEYEVSLQSAYSVITNVDRDKYEPILIGISRKGNWYLYQGEEQKIPANTWETEKCTPVAVSTDKELHGLLILKDTGVEMLSLDAAFPVLHGKNGEDGTVQGVLELADIPIVGCNTLSSAICMDKDVAHRLADAAGVRVPQSYLLRKEDMSKIADFGEELGYPLFVKPLRAGSSFGVAKVDEREALKEAVKNAFEHDVFVLMEEMIDGFEVGCAVLGTEKLTIGAVDEIELSSGFFDFTEKYTLKTSSIHVPARISEEKAKEIKNTAGVLYRALGCTGFARVDMFLNSRGEIYFNEINTIPGFTSHSRYPNMLKEVGVGFAQIVNTVIEMALVK